MNVSTEHKHDFKSKKTKARLHSYAIINGAMKMSHPTGYDILDQRVCDCGAVETLSLKRQER